MDLQTLGYTRSSGWSGPLGELDSDRTMVLAFGASGFFDDRAPLDELRRSFPRSHVLGCSTAGEILGDKVSDESITVAVARFSEGWLSSVSTPAAPGADSFTSGQSLGRALSAPTLRAVLVLSDGLNVNGSELVRGLNAVLADSVVITGGLAGDGDRFQRTWVLEGGTPRTGVIVALGLHGPGLRVGHGSKGGWDAFGPERRVTRARGSVLYELDGKPALKLYKDYLGERASGLPATALLFPLALRSSRNDERSIVRTVLSIDEADQSMTFAGDVPEGSWAKLMRANFDRLVDGAGQAALATGACDGTVLSVAISCVGRRLVLGERTEEEIEATLEVLPPGTRQIGFYSYGEISPHASGRCELHNQTMTLTTFSEG